MTADELRQLQAPIKARYKLDPGAAAHTFHARGTLLADKPSVRLDTRFARFDAGLHPKAGGDDSEACSGDLLLESLVACAGVTFNVVATAMGIPFTRAEVIVEGDGDFRGTLGLAKDVPVGMTDIRLRFEIDSPASDDQLATLLKLTERYCVIAQTLRQPPTLTASLVRSGSAPGAA
ncbi:MAG: OsmC family protein [Rubrivivax sp.]|nr:OsmC family protein [Rubrivivax sp.]